MHRRVLLQRVQIQLDFSVQLPLQMDLQTLISMYCHLQLNLILFAMGITTLIDDENTFQAQ